MTGAELTILIASTVLTAALMYGATLRLTRLITEDTITGPLRAAVLSRWGPQSKAYEWVRCPWCIGLWIAYAVAAAVLAGELITGHRLVLLPPWLWVPLAPLMINYYAARELTR